jgi:septal ring-binding cell division protein DamX
VPSADGFEFGGGAPPAPPRGGFGAVLAWVLGGLVVLVAAVVFIRSRTATTVGSAGPSIATSSVAPAPTTAPTEAVAVVVVPSPVPTAPAVAATSVPAPRRTAVPVPTRAAAVRPTPRPPASHSQAPSAAPAAASTGSAERVPGSRSEWSARAAREQKRLAGEPSVRYSIQLELACEVPSLAEAWKYDRPAGSMWVLTTRHGPKECFRVLWGRYPTLDAAKAAKSSAPAYFNTASNHPAVVSVR